MDFSTGNLRRVLLVMVLISAPIAAWAQHPGALHLWYATPPGGGDLIVNRVRSTAVAPNTYYEVFGWNPGGEAGGYTGIQLGTSRNMIFSIWDPSNGNPITVVYQEPGSRSNAFGGEGTGLHWDNTPLGHSWNLGTWYTFVCRSWPVGTGASAHTQFAMWSLDESTGQWTHHVTMDFPMVGQNFNFGINSFLEMWAGYDPAIRRAEFRDTWMRRANGIWSSICGAGTSTDGGLSNPPAGSSACGGVSNGSIFLRSGEVYQANMNVSVPLSLVPRTEYAVAALTSGGCSFDPIANEFSVYWAVDPARAPQWKYKLEIFTSPDGTGSPILNREEIAPHARAVLFSLAQLPLGHYSAKISVRDLFDRDAPPLVFAFDRADVRSTYISDMPWVSSTNGWGPVERDRSNGESGPADGHTITLDGVTFAKGIGCHANSEISVSLGGRYWEFFARVGVDDEVLANGSVVFNVFLDGVLAISSLVLTGTSATLPVRIDVRGVNVLRLEVLDAGDGNAADHADWAAACVTEPVCPTFAAQPTLSTVCPYRTASFSVTAAGTGPFTYRWQWRRIGQQQWLNVVSGTNTDGTAFFHSTGGLSSQTDVTGYHEGATGSAKSEFRCVLTNACGSVTSDSATLSICAADLTCDGIVDDADFVRFLVSYNSLTIPPADPQCDFNGDALVDDSDFSIFVVAYDELICT